MRRKRFLATTVAAIGVMVGAGCGQPCYPDALDVTLEQVDLIRNSDTLEPQEMRDALAEYGLDPVTINALLSDIRLANQFGADYSPPLTCAYDKVTGDQLRSMTPDEVQYYGDATDQATLTDAEAQAIVDLFQDNEIDSLTGLEEWLSEPANELPEEIDEVNLRGVFVDTSTEYVWDKL